jgi:ubiquinone/menaquinone biosynthesis C-methylase UbiE
MARWPNRLAAGSSAMIEVASRSAGERAGLEFSGGEACAIPYLGDFFDKARSESVFLYLPDRIASIREMKRVVKPAGCVCIVDTNLDCAAVYSKKPSLTRKMTSLVAATKPNPNSARELLALARKAGRKNVKTETFAIATPHEFFVRVMAESLMKAAEDGIVPRSEVDEWLEEQALLRAATFFRCGFLCW